MKIETTAYIKDGKLFVRNRSYIEREAVKSGVLEFDVIIQKKSKHRSVSQNRWYWAAMQILSEHLGYTKNEMHEIAKFKFLKVELVNEKTGEVFERIRNTPELTTVEFSVYMEEIIKWSAETFDVLLPYPNEQLTII